MKYKVFVKDGIIIGIAGKDLSDVDRTKIIGQKINDREDIKQIIKNAKKSKGVVEKIEV